MIFAEKKVRLKDGREAIFRSPIPSDAEQMLRFLKTAAGETDFLTRYPEDCTETPEYERAFIDRVNGADTMLMIVCDVEGKLAGTCQLVWNNRIKTRHRAEVAIGLLREYWSLGIGSAMFEELIRVAREQGILQLELDYVEGNDRAKRLYEKMGFREVAVKPDAIRLKDGTMLSDISMVKKL